MKLTRVEESNVRANFYNLAMKSFEEYQTEPVCEGRLIEFENNGEKHYATLKITIHNSEKFNLEQTRKQYIDKLEAAANRQAEAAEKAQIKAERAKVKAERDENLEGF